MIRKIAIIMVAFSAISSCKKEYVESTSITVNDNESVGVNSEMRVSNNNQKAMSITFNTGYSRFDFDIKRDGPYRLGDVYGEFSEVGSKVDYDSLPNEYLYKEIFQNASTINIEKVKGKNQDSKRVCNIEGYVLFVGELRNNESPYDILRNDTLDISFSLKNVPITVVD